MRIIPLVESLYYPREWYIHTSDDTQIFDFTSVSEAKAYAVEHLGASGKWDTKKVQSPTNGKMMTHYYERGTDGTS